MGRSSDFRFKKYPGNLQKGRLTDGQYICFRDKTFVFFYREPRSGNNPSTTRRFHICLFYSKKINLILTVDFFYYPVKHEKKF